jgi:hypothetical protein
MAQEMPDTRKNGTNKATNQKGMIRVTLFEVSLTDLAVTFRSVLDVGEVVTDATPDSKMSSPAVVLPISPAGVAVELVNGTASSHTIPTSSQGSQSLGSK